jgi:hypothetical protein
MDKLEIFFHLSMATVVATAIGLASYGVLVVTLAFVKVLG